MIAASFGVSPAYRRSDPLRSFAEQRSIGSAVVIDTHCLFPNGDHVSIVVHHDAGKPKSIVSDGGSWWEAMNAAGFDPDANHIVRAATEAATSAGFQFAGGEFNAREVSDEELSATIIILANTVQAFVARAVARMRPREASLDAKLLATLERRFGPPAVTHHAEVSGLSSRAYPMTALVKLSRGRVALFRTVTPYPASLYACTAAYGDIARAGSDDPRVAVIERQEAWPAADLALLGQTATSILDLSRSPEAALGHLSS